MIVDTAAYKSKLYHFEPCGKIITGLLPLFSCLLAKSILVGIVTILVMSTAAIFFSGISAVKYLKLLAVPFGFLILGVVTVAVVRIETATESQTLILLFRSGFGITYSSALNGCILFCKALGAVCCMYFITLNATMSQISLALKRLHIPGLVVALMLLTYKCLFIVMQQGKKMKISGTSRLGYYGFFRSLYSFGQLFAGLFTKTLLKSDALYAAMASRGFDGTIPLLESDYKSAYPMVVGGILFSVLLATLGAFEGVLL